MSDTAVKIKDLSGWNGHASLYRLDPPLDGEEYVIASAARVSGLAIETYLFPSDKDGNPKSYSEMDGSVKGTLSHADALGLAGYEIKEVPA